MKTETLATSTHRVNTVEAYQAAIERIIHHMQGHLDEPLDLVHLAQIGCISKFHLVRVFDEVTGTTPHHFLASLRIQKAKELLLNSGASITDICLQVGYNSLGSFSRTFTSLVGVTPQQFRRLPKKLTPTLFAKAVWHYLAADQPKPKRPLEGVVEGPRKPRGFTFVGVFTSGVPQGAPLSGTVIWTPGKFRIEQPDLPEFHLLAAFIPLTADLSTIVTTLPVRLVAGFHVQRAEGETTTKYRLSLRPLRLTDPPIVLALPALGPFREMFAN